MSISVGEWKWLDYPDGRKLLTARNNAVIHCPDAPMSIDPDDARLIAAAPELLEALKHAIEVIETWHSVYDADGEAWAIYRENAPEMKRINAAIAKAEGQ